MSAPYQYTDSVRIPAMATAANDLTSVALRARMAATITGVRYAPDAALSGANTNSRTLTIVNKGQDGLGAVVVASLALVSGVNLVAFDELALTLSATPANLIVAAGDILAFFSDAVLTGIVDPGGELSIDFSRN